ncbi:MAG: ArsR family transcriptional regulator [Planctomycetota bacterium]|nr:ArsR family transcriptional regulator [Planctomycetota bacterium]
MDMNMNRAVKAVSRSTKSPHTMDKLLTLLGGTVRLAIIRELLVESRSVSKLADAVEQSIGLVSHNLKLLREQGLVVSTPSARHRYYSMSPRVQVEHHPDGTRLGFTASCGERVSLMLQHQAEAVHRGPQAVQVQKTGIENFKNQRQPGEIEHRPG